VTLQGYSIATTFYLFLKTFKEGLKTKIKMTITSMPQRTLVKVVESTIMIEEEMPVRKISIVKYRQDFDSE